MPAEGVALHKRRKFISHFSMIIVHSLDEDHPQGFRQNEVSRVRSGRLSRPTDTRRVNHVKGTIYPYETKCFRTSRGPDERVEEKTDGEIHEYMLTYNDAT